MYLNRFVFPAPHPSYSVNSIKENLIWVQRPKAIPEPKRSPKKSYTIPIEKVPEFTNDPHSIRSFKELDSCKKSTVAFTEVDVSREICLQPNTARNQASSPLRTKSGVMDLEEDRLELPNFEDYFNVRKSLPSLSSQEKEGKKANELKKKHKSACFGFLGRTKSHILPRNEELDALQKQKMYKNCKTEDLDMKESPKKGSSSNGKANKNSRPVSMVQIPCLYIHCDIPTQKTMLFFHGNGEDIYMTAELLRFMSEYLQVNVMAVEYPGYGIYKGSPSEKSVLLDAEAVYNYLVNDLQIKEEDILVTGRSLGSGPATYLASKKNPGMLILISAFTSLRAVVKHSFGNTARYLIKERFNNLKAIPSVRCPVFILHGEKDALIPYHQAQELYDAVRSTRKIYIAKNMDHGSFDFLNDLIIPLKTYLDELNILNSPKTAEIISLPSSDDSLYNSLAQAS